MAEVGEILSRLDDPRPVMEAIGSLMVAASQKAFSDKAFGDYSWPSQYENQTKGKGPWIHVAGAASDLSKGDAIKGSRYAPADTLRDSHDLFNSIAVKTTSKTEVTVGSTIPYAKYHQWGSKQVGPSVLAITPSMKEGLKKEIAGASDDKKLQLKALWHFFRKDSIETFVRQRPFVGITDELEDDIRQSVIMFVEEGKL